MAGAAGSPAVRLGAAVGALMHAVGATSGLVLHGGQDGMEIRAVGPAAATTSDRQPPQLRVLVGEQPLIDPILAGDLEVTTAARAFGSAAWKASRRRQIALDDWGVDQLLAVPVRSGPDFIVFLLGRRGRDFSDGDVALLGSLLPAMTALASLLEPDLLPEPDRVVHRLTRRESTILSLLARGHTAVRIAHLAGCSPRTVHHHLANIYSKLGVRDRLSAVNKARELALVPSGPPDDAADAADAAPGRG
jgi:DNA-binding CsgD family transcriptional regulator